jgi:hypothetical protein
MRLVIIHYHIFKNAGSTIDSMLQNSFGESWATFDGEVPTSRISPERMADFIVRNPEIRAVSSHQAWLPLPAISNVQVFPVVFFRHPLDRARSVYDFERKQGRNEGPVSEGAEHAMRLSFADYLRWRFDSSKNGVVHNHQTAWLLHEKKYLNHDITEKDFDRACIQLESLNFFGLVEDFQRSINLLADRLMQQGVKFDITDHVVNSTSGRHESLRRRLEALREDVGEKMWGELLERNRWDCLLHDVATMVFMHRVKHRLHTEELQQSKL